MILVSGAAGKTGLAAIRALVARGAAVRALVRREAQAARLRELGARDVVVGDMHDAGAMAAAARNSEAVYHIPPNVSPDEVAIGEVAIAAARQAGVRLFVYHSVLHPQIEAMPHHWQKLRVEEALIDSGLPFVILEPASYMQNVLAGWDDILRGQYRIPYGAATRLGLVDLADVAAAAAAVLTERGHAGATYELAGPEILDQGQVARLLGEALGRSVVPVAVPLDEWERQARAGGLGDYQVQALLAMFRYYATHGFAGNPRVLAWLLGRQPTAFSEFAQRVARERRR